MFKLFIVAVALLGCVWNVNAVEAGMGLAIGNKVLETSKKFIVEHLSNVLNNAIDIPDFSLDFMGQNHMYNQYLQIDSINPADLDVYFHEGMVHIDFNAIGAGIYGKGKKRALWGSTERFGYHATGMRGTFALSFKIKPQLTQKDGVEITVPAVYDFVFKVKRRDLMDIDIDSRDASPLLMKASVHAFKDKFIDMLLDQVNRAPFENRIDLMIKDEFWKSKGSMPMDFFKFALMLVPNNRITIPPEVRIKYDQAADTKVIVDEEHGMMYGYYTAAMTGMGDQAITDPLFHTPGDLQIKVDGTGDPFQYQVSTSFINDVFEVLLGKNEA